MEKEIDVIEGVRAVVDETLSLGGRGHDLNPDSELLGAIPELDSQAVLNVLVGIEEHFEITIDDDEIDASIFEKLSGLIGLVEGKISS